MSYDRYESNYKSRHSLLQNVYRLFTQLQVTCLDYFKIKTNTRNYYYVSLHTYCKRCYRLYKKRVTIYTIIKFY